MTSWMRRVLGPIPDWAQPTNPLLRYEITRAQPDDHPRSRFVRVTGNVLLLSTTLLIGIFIATDGLQTPAGNNFIDASWQVIVIPIFALQVLLRVLALVVGFNSIGDDRRRHTWDSVRATELGTAIALRARWLSVLYRLRGLFLLTIGARIVLVGGVLIQLTSHRGAMLDAMLLNAVPVLPTIAGVLLLAAIITGAMLLPVTAAGFDAALGLLIAAAIPSRTFGAIVQLLAVAARVALTVGVTLAALAWLTGGLMLPEPVAWGVFGLFSTSGDLGLYLLNLPQAGSLWALLPYSIFFGVLLTLWALLQVRLTDILLARAVHFADLRD